MLFRSKALALYQQGAAAGDVHSQTRLGLFYRDGIAVKADRAQAESWLKKAAAKGDVESFVGLGSLYDRRDSANFDAKEALRWYGVAAQRGSLPAVLAIGQLYVAEHEFDKAQPYIDLLLKHGDSTMKANAIVLQDQIKVLQAAEKAKGE